LTTTAASLAALAEQSRVEQLAHDTVTAIDIVYRKLALDRVEQLVTIGLQAIFEHDYAFRFHVEPKRGQAETTIIISDQGKDLDPTTEMGGSVVDVVSLLLRVVLWTQMHERSAPLFLLDEPARMVSAQYRPALAAFLQRLSKELQVQFFIVTHEPAIASSADRVFEVTKDGQGVSHVGILR